MDQPGTPIAIIGSVLLALTAPFISDAFVSHHLRNPELFFTLARVFLVVATTVGIFVLSRWALDAHSRLSSRITPEHWAGSGTS